MLLELKTMLNNTKKKYGEFSLAALSLRISYLSCLLKQTELDKLLIDQLVREIEITYNSGIRAESSLKKYMYRCATEENVIYRFSPDYFYKHYGEVLKCMEQYIIRINSYNELSLCEDLKWYVYALSKENQVILLNNPMNSIDLVLNRNDFKINNIAAVHPMLVYKEDFEARMLGELTIIFNDDSKLPVAAIINNKSGHYRPLAKDLKFVVELFLEMGMELDRIVCININC